MDLRSKRRTANRRQTARPAAAGPVSWDRLDWAIITALGVAILTAYAQVRTHEFINFDDLYYVRDPHTIAGMTWPGIVWAFTSARSPSFWFPLTRLSHMMDRQIFGDQSGWHHLVSVVIHLCSSLLLFVTLKKATQARWRSAFVAFVFALHPLHVESVAWVAERKDVLSGLFWILTMWVYLRYVGKPSTGRYLVVIVMFCCGLMSKAMVVTLPFALLLLDVWPLRRVTGPIWLVVEKLPLFALSLAASLITFFAQREGGAVQTIAQLSLSDRIGNALISYVAYLINFVWPLNLAAFYPYSARPAAEVVAAGVLLALITLAALKAGRDRYLAVGWLWYLGTLVPVIGLVQAGDQSRADRFTYIPMIGISIMLAWGATATFERRAWSMTAWTVLAGCLCSFWFVLTFIDVGYWQDSATLFRRALEVTNGNYVAYNNLGAALRKEGKIDEAIADFEAAVSLRPLSGEAQNNLGEALLAGGQAPAALPHLLQAVRLEPDSAYARTNLGAALNLAGQTTEAESQYRQATRMEPELAAAHVGLGNVLVTAGRLDQALPELLEGVRLDPQDTRGHDNLGKALMKLERTDEAITQFSEAIRLQPDNTEAHLDLGIAFGSRGRTAEALEEFRTSSRLSPAYVAPHFNAGVALGSLGRYEEAVREFREVLRLNPGLVNARRNFDYYSELLKKSSK